MSIQVSEITSGPAQVLLGGTEIGHTEGGVTLTVTPQNRPRNVDQFGGSEVDIIHTGDEVRAQANFAEWTSAVLAEIYNPGRDQLSLGSGSTPYLGLGRSSGYTYTDKSMQLVPRVTADQGKRCILWRTTPIGAFTLTHNSEDDRMFEVERACLVKESETDGQLIGKLQLSA